MSEHFKAAFEFAPIGMALVSMEGRICKVNKCFCQLLGLPPEQLLTCRMEDLLYAPEMKGKDCLRQIKEQGIELCRQEIEYLHRSGKLIWLMVSAALIKEDEGTSSHCIVQLEDITERKTAEFALKESEAKFKSYINQSIDGVHVIDREGRYLDVNPAGAAMFGYKTEELLSMGIGDIIAPGETDGFDHFQNLVEKGQSIGEITALTRNGSLITIEINAVALGEDRYMGIVRDITARKHAEEMLLASEERFRSAFNYAPIGMCLVALDGSFIKVNRALCEILGYSEEELLCTNFKQITHPGDLNTNVDHQRRLVMGESKNYSTEKKYIHKSGHIVHCLLSATLVRDNLGQPLYFVSQIYDISEQKQAVTALAEREQMYRTLFEKSANPILVIDREGQYIDCNEEAQRFFECQRKEILNMRVEDTLPSGRPVSLEQHMLLWEKGGTIETEYHINGLTKVLDLSITPILWKGREAIIGIGRDITTQKENEKTLRESEERYRRLVEFFPDTISIVNNGKIVFVNKAGVQLFSAQKKEMLTGKPIFDFVHDDYKEIIKGKIDAVMGGAALGQLEAKFLDIEGRPIDVEVAVIPFTYKGRSMVQMVIEDITKSKQTEGALATEKQRLAVTLHSIGEGVITADSDGKIVLANDVAAALTRWPKEAMIGKTLSEVLKLRLEKTGEHCKDAALKVLETHRPISIPEAKVLVAIDGTETIIEDSATPVLSDKGQIIGVVLVFRDITNQRKIEEEFLKVEKLESLGILAGGIAHDFNNILTVVLGNISITRMLLPDNMEIDEQMEEVEQAIVQARDLTKQLLTFAKGGAPILRTASIKDLIRHTASFALRGSNVKSDIGCNDNLWDVEVDEGQICQVINNLIINANQAMPGGGVLKIKAENIAVGKGEFVTLDEGNYVKVTVEDQGIGIPEENLPRIFDPYFSTKQKGSGLGLATAFSIIKKHNGHIAVESELNQGTKFYIYLPASANKVAARNTKRSAPVMGSGRILIMEDEPAIRHVAKTILVRSGYEVSEAIDGEEAIELYKLAKSTGKTFDLLIMDLTVPGGMGGKEAISRLLKLDPDIKAIVSSGYSNDPIMANYEEYGFSGVVAKPYKANELTEAVFEVIELAKRKKLKKSSGSAIS